MRQDKRRQERRSGAWASTSRTRSRPTPSFSVEPLEGRRLLSIYMGPTKSRPLFSGHAFYQITVTGPGYQTVSQLGKGHHRIIAINLVGTTSESQLNITQQSARRGFGTANTALQIGQINIQSGQLGGINAQGTADLVGAVTPLQGGTQTLQFNGLGPNARIDVEGSVGTFQVGSTDLSPNGQVHITGGVTDQLSVGSMNITGGKFLIDGDANNVSLGGLNVQQSGQFIIGHDLTGSLHINGVETIKSNGLFQVGSDVGNTTNSTSVIGSLDIDGGRMLIGHDVLVGHQVSPIIPLTIGDLTIQNRGVFNIGHDIPDGLTVTGNEKILNNGLFQVGDNLGGLNVGQDLTLDTSGKLSVGEDITAAVNLASGLSVSNNAQLSVGRDILKGLNLTGDLKLDSGGNIVVGRNLDTLNVNGNIVFTPSAGTFVVQGDLNGLTINGIYQGRNNTSTSSPEMIIGLDLTNFTVLGGIPGQGSIEDANISVGKDIIGFNIAHGIFNSLITAGVLIENGTIGPDGADAVFDSEIRAGVRINNITMNGNVRSDYVTNPNPTGYRTRIVAGEDRQGNFTSGGNIDNFQITGALIDAVLAARVQPNGGDGTLPPSGYGANRTQSNTPGDDGYDTYDAPAGVIAGGTFSNPIAYPNYSEVSYFNGNLTGVAWNTAIDPTIDDNILQGAINPSFATSPAPTSQTSTVTTNNQSSSVTSTVTTTSLALPTKSTVLGGVISTSHGDNPDANDFAGIFAADTRGVFVGTLPQKSSG